MHRSRARALVPALALTAAVAVGIVGAALWLRHGAGPAQPTPATALRPAARTPADVLGSLPDDIDLAVIVDHAANLRASPVGASAIRLLDDAGALKDLQAAWTALAQQLGWGTGEAFDRLLGRRVVLVSKAIPGTSERRWAILSDVTPDTEARLRERLEAAPRAVDKGHQILSLEKGQYELTAHRRTPAVPGAKGDAGEVTLVFGPAGRAELFDQMVGVLAGGAPAPLAGHDVHAQAARLGDAEALVAASFEPPRPHDADAPGEPTAPHAPAAAVRPRWTDFVVLAGGRDDSALRASPGAAPGTAWRSRVILRDASRRDELASVSTSSDAAFRALSEGSLLAVVQNAPLPVALGPVAPLDSVLGWLPLPDRAKALTGDGQALALRAAGPDGAELVAGTVALRTPATRALAEVLDPAIARGVKTFEERLGVATPSPPDFGGIAPAAARVVDITAAPTGPLSILSSRPLVVAWAYPPLAGADAADGAPRVVPASLASPAAPDRPGWWVMTIGQTAPAPGPGQLQALRPPGSPPPAPSPTPAELVRHDAAALTSPGTDAAETARWIALASARPAALEALIPTAIPDIRGFRSLLRRFDDVGLKLHITEEGDVMGDLSLRLAPTRE